MSPSLAGGFLTTAPREKSRELRSCKPHGMAKKTPKNKSKKPYCDFSWDCESVCDLGILGVIIIFTILSFLICEHDIVAFHLFRASETSFNKAL